MRGLTVILGLIALVAAGSSKAAEPASISAPAWVLPPSDGNLESYPTVPGHLPASGSAVVRCHRYPNGEMDRCDVVSETPAGAGFGSAAAVWAVFSHAPTPPSEAFVAADEVQFQVTFDGPAQQALLASRPKGVGHILTNPHWKAIPSGDDLARVWPAEATRQGVGGHVRVVCYVTVEGLLDRCRVLNESPVGVGFGEAALLMTRYFSMVPKTVDGVPEAGAVIVIPLTFAAPRGGMPVGPATGQSVSVLNAPIWSATPTLAQLDAAFPKNEIGKADEAHLVMRCRIGHDGALRSCDPGAAAPDRFSFKNAAYDLIKLFRLDVAAYPHEPYWDDLVDVPITFIAPGKPATNQITDPIWTRTVDSTKVLALYPAQAAKAGVKTGRAIVDCIADHAGQLTDCQVSVENPPGLGFGGAAVRIANAMALNPWTPQGRPVDGNHIRLPVVQHLAPDPSPSDVAAKP